MSRIVNVLPFGACHLHIPLTNVLSANAGIAYAKICEPRIPIAYTFAEAFQLLDLLRGTRNVPEDIRLLNLFFQNFRVLPTARNLENVDVVLIEPATPIETEFRGYAVNRTALVVHGTRPIAAVSAHAAKLAATWFNLGLLGMNVKVQMEAAEELISLMPPDMPNPELAKALLREARARQRDIRENFRRLLDLVGPCPVGVVTYIFRYLPDGRVISWPDGYREQLTEVAGEFGLPVFDPSTLVLKHGVQAAMQGQTHHYSDEFVPIVGTALAEFARSVFETSHALRVA